MGSEIGNKMHPKFLPKGIKMFPSGGEVLGEKGGLVFGALADRAGA
jgi:hypothetical protein